MAADFLDCAQINPRLHFVAVRPCAAAACGTAERHEAAKQGFRDALGAFDLVGGGVDRRAKRARASDRVCFGVGREVVHAGLPARANGPSTSTGSLACRRESQSAKLPYDFRRSHSCPESKGKIRHFALSVPDPWATAEFYKEAFGMEELGETDGKLAEGVSTMEW